MVRILVCVLFLCFFWGAWYFFSKCISFVLAVVGLHMCLGGKLFPLNAEIFYWKMTLLLVWFLSLIINLGRFSKHHGLRKGVIGAGPSWKINRAYFSIHMAYQIQARLNGFWGVKTGLTLVMWRTTRKEWRKADWWWENMDFRIAYLSSCKATFISFWGDRK